jgi:hypothetical protein
MGDEIDGLAPRDLQNLAVAENISHPQRRQAGLFRAEEFAGPAQLQVHLGDVEAVGGFDQGSYAFARRVVHFLGYQHAVALGGAAPHPAAAPERGPATPAASADVAAAHARDRVPGRPSHLRAIAVNAVALLALLVAAVTILALWRTEGPIDAGALRPSSVLAALRRGAGEAPFAAREVRSGLYERERAPPVLFVRGSVVSRAPAPVARVRITVEVLRGGAVVARGDALAGALPTPEELWGAHDAAALAALAAAAAARAPARVSPGDDVPFLVAIADQPADLAGTTLRVEVAPSERPAP